MLEAAIVLDIVLARWMEAVVITVLLSVNEWQGSLKRRVPEGTRREARLVPRGDKRKLQAKRRSLKLMFCFQSSTLPMRRMLPQVPL
jgi:hypothetical protein